MTATLQNELKWGDLIDPDDPSKGKYYPLHKYQRKVYESTKRFTAAIAGTGGGKTVTGPLWLIKKIQEHYAKTTKSFLGMVVAPTYKVLDRATVPTLIDTFKYTALEGSFKQQRGIYELPDGGKLWCQGADNAGGLEGGQFDAVWIDEGGQVKQSVWTALQGRTGQKRAPILVTTTPYANNWLFHEFYKRWLGGDQDYLVVQFSSIENPTYSKEEYDRAKKTLGAKKGAMRYDGAFTGFEGKIYENIGDCIVHLSPEDRLKLISNPGKFYGGLDFGWNDPFAGLCGFLDEFDVLWIFWERYKSKTTIEEHCDALIKIDARPVKWFADHEPELICKLRKGGHKVKAANKAKVLGWEAVNARINTGRLKIIANSCPALVAESEGYVYDIDEDNPGGEEEVDKDNHACDALRYLIVGIDRKKAA